MENSNLKSADFNNHLSAILHQVSPIRFGMGENLLTRVEFAEFAKNEEIQENMAKLRAFKEQINDKMMQAAISDM